MAFTHNVGSDDCYFYYYSSCTKGNSCMYRHCEAALGNETVCELWRSGQCTESDCMFRHMEIQQKRGTVACYWESQPGGCRKPHCVFRHDRPRDEGGTMLSEEEKLAAITSPPPQMAMPMVEDPPDLYNIPVLPQDSVRSTDSPTVERLVINPFEEETDEESVHGTPVKSSHMTRVEHLKIQAKPKVTKKSEKEETDNGQKELNFSVKSLDQIRQEKLERAKRLIEEADNLLSQEESELVTKVQEVKKKLDKPQGNVDKEMPQQEKAATVAGYTEKKNGGEVNSSSSTTAGKVIKIAKKPQADDKEDEAIGVKSYEEILREKALASMMKAKAKKLEEQKKSSQPESKPKVETKGQRLTSKDENSISRRVVVRIKSASEDSQENLQNTEKSAPVAKTTIHTRLGPKASTKVTSNSTDQRKGNATRALSIKSRLGIQKVEGKRKASPAPAENSRSDSETETVNNRPKVSSIKSRLGIKRVEAKRRTSPVLQDSDSDREQSQTKTIKSHLGIHRIKAPKETSPVPSQHSNSDSEGDRGNRKLKPSIRNRLGVQKAAVHEEERSPIRPSLAAITMSDFSSDGMSDSETEEVEARAPFESETEEVETRVPFESESETEEKETKVNVLSRRAAVKTKKDATSGNRRKNIRGNNEPIGIKSLDEILKEKALKSLKHGSSGAETEESDVEEAQVAVEVKPRTLKLGVKRKVTRPVPESSPPKIKIKTLSEIKRAKQSVKRTVQVCTEESDESEELDETVESSKLMKSSVKAVVTRPRSRAAAGEKVEKRAPRMQLYRPPALKELMSVSVRKPVIKSLQTTGEEEPTAPRKKNNWSVKTFSEVLREKQLKREQQTDPESSDREKPSLKPLRFGPAEDTGLINKKTKTGISPIKFGEDSVDGSVQHNDTSEPIFKITGLVPTASKKKRSHSPEIVVKPCDRVPERSSQSETNSKKLKRSSVWSTRNRGSETRSVEAEETVSMLISRKISIQRQLGEMSAPFEEKAATEKKQTSGPGVSSAKTLVSSNSKKTGMLFGKPRVDVVKTEPHFEKKSHTSVQQEKLGTFRKKSATAGVQQEKVELFSKKAAAPNVQKMELFGKKSGTTHVQTESVKLFGKTQQPKNSTAEAIQTEHEDSGISLKSPVTSSSSALSRPSTKPVRKPSTPKVVTPANRRRSSTKDTIQSPSGPDSDILLTENEESLNLEDTLEDEFVQLLGSDTNDMVTSSNYDMEVDPDEDLLKEMEELLG